MKWWLPAFTLLTACTALPQDADGTSDAVHARGRVRIGVAAGAPDAPQARALMVRIGEDAGGRATVVSGDTETLVVALQEGRLDVVIAPFAAKSPFADKITLAPPVARFGPHDAPMLIRAAVRNGESRWAMLVEHAARTTAPQLASEG